MYLYHMHICWIPLEVGLWMLVSHHIGARAFARATSSLSHRVICLALEYLFEKCFGVHVLVLKTFGRTALCYTLGVRTPSCVCPKSTLSLSEPSSLR